MTGILETSAGSISGSILAFFIIKFWKSLTRRIKLRALIINDENNMDKIESLSDEDILFINLRKMLGKDYPTDMIRNDVRVKVFPKAKACVHKLKDQFKKKTIVILSNDLELIRYIGITKNHITSIMPSENLIQELHKNNPQEDYNKIKLEVLKTINKKNINIVDNHDQVINVVKDLFKVNLK